jgi:hypothetical protein
MHVAFSLDLAHSGYHYSWTIRCLSTDMNMTMMMPRFNNKNTRSSGTRIMPRISAACRCLPGIAENDPGGHVEQTVAPELEQIRTLLHSVQIGKKAGNHA